MAVEIFKKANGCWRVEVYPEQVLDLERNTGFRFPGESGGENSSLVLTPLFCLSPDNVFECTD